MLPAMRGSHDHRRGHPAQDHDTNAQPFRFLPRIAPIRHSWEEFSDSGAAEGANGDEAD